MRVMRITAPYEREFLIEIANLLRLGEHEVSRIIGAVTPFGIVQHRIEILQASEQDKGRARELWTKYWQERSGDDPNMKDEVVYLERLTHIVHQLVHEEIAQPLRYLVVDGSLEPEDSWAEDPHPPAGKRFVLRVEIPDGNALTSWELYKRYPELKQWIINGRRSGEYIGIRDSLVIALDSDPDIRHGSYIPD